MDALDKAKEYLTIAEQESGVPKRVLASILAAERGPDLLQTWPSGLLNGAVVETNNPADISGNGNEPWYEGVTGVLSNNVSVFRTLPDGAIAWGRLLRYPPSPMHLPGNWFQIANSAPEVALRLFAESDYAASHYHATAENPAGDLAETYNSDIYKPLWADETVTQEPVATDYMTQIMPILETEAKANNVPLDMAVNQARVESGGNPKAVSPAGAMGVMQLMPETAKALGVTDPFDPQQNIAAGMRDDATLYAQFGAWDLALAAYNAGSGTVANLIAQHGKSYAAIKSYLPQETQNYVSDILEAESAPAAVTKAPKHFEIYRVRPGNTLSRIAVAYGIPVADILEYNHIPNPDFITPGQQIRIPRY